MPATDRATRAEAERLAIARSLTAARTRRLHDASQFRQNAPMARRSYGTGSLFVKSGMWYGRWWVGNQRVKRALGPVRSVGTREGLTQTQAERELRRRIECEAAVVRSHDRLTLIEAGERYVDHLEHVIERKRTTIEDYRGYLRRHLEPFFGDRGIERIEPQHVMGYIKRKRAQGLSAKTVQNHLTFVHGVFVFAKKRGWVSANPVTAVDRPRRTTSAQRRIRFLQPAELDALLRAVPDDTLAAADGALYLTAAMTGLRQGELLALRWRDVDWVAARVRVADNFPRGRVDEPDSPKSHEGRSVPMSDRVATQLERLFQRSSWQGENDLVFCHPETGRVLDASKVRKRFAAALARAGVHEITFHELRHTFGTQLAAAGAPLRAIQEWMGHADAKTTEIYRHYAPDPTGGAALVERAFGRGPNLGPNTSKSEQVSEDQKVTRRAKPDAD
jgi:integrase